MKIIVDAFGGDHAPLAVIEGCRQAVDELGAEILLTGDEEKIRQAAAEAKISLDGMEIGPCAVGDPGGGGPHHPAQEVR